MIIEIKRETIDNFKKSWPCHGIPDSCDGITVYLQNGDLVDYEMYDVENNVIEEGDDCGDALSALFHDAEKNSHGEDVSRLRYTTKTIRTY